MSNDEDKSHTCLSHITEQALLLVFADSIVHWNNDEDKFLTCLSHITEQALLLVFADSIVHSNSDEDKFLTCLTHITEQALLLVFVPPVLLFLLASSLLLAPEATTSATVAVAFRDLCFFSVPSLPDRTDEALEGVGVAAALEAALLSTSPESPASAL